MNSTLEAYEALAPRYDEFTHQNNHERWLQALLPELERTGLKKGHLLDIGCGTGHGFEPMLRRGWKITGCDFSPSMLASAQQKFGGRVSLVKADICELPSLGKFELIWALNAVINCLANESDLQRAFQGVASNLAPAGRFLIDTNSLKLFKAEFTKGGNGLSAKGMNWTGLTVDGVRGGVWEARLSGSDLKTRTHRHRHYSIEQIRRTMDASGLELLAVRGQLDQEDGMHVVSHLDEDAHDRALCIAGPKV